MVKITKGLAKKMWEKGEEVMVIPNRVKPDSMLAFWTTKPVDDSAATFEKLCNAIHYYNCTPETGMTLAYYAKDGI